MSLCSFILKCPFWACNYYNGYCHYQLICWLFLKIKVHCLSFALKKNFTGKDLWLLINALIVLLSTVVCTLSLFDNMQHKIYCIHNIFSLGRAPANRKAQTSEPDCYPFCLSSLISSLSSLKVRRLRWRNKTLMVRHLWNARTEIHPKKQFHTLTRVVQPGFAKSHKSRVTLLWSCLAKQYQCSGTAELVGHAVDQWGKYRMSSHCYKSLRQNTETWWNTSCFSWLTAVVSLALFTVVLESDVTWPWSGTPFI